MNGWIEERRVRQSQLIRTWKPWNQSSGPKTKKGKQKTSMNAYKGGVRAKMSEMARCLAEQRRYINNGFMVLHEKNENQEGL